jgi:phenylacetate-CoA ligase
LLWPALPDARTAQLLSLAYQLERSQWWPRAALERGQQIQLDRLLQHARSKSALYAERPQHLADFPLLTRRELLTQAELIHCADIGPEHGRPQPVQTSGSTGEIVSVQRTDHSRLMLMALGLRVGEWHRFDYSQTLAVIRADSPRMDDDERARKLGWGMPSALLYRTGPGYALPISTNVSEQAAWLERRRPGYLLTYPTNLSALLDVFERAGKTLPGLRCVRSLGETLSKELRERCRRVWGAPVIDVYSAQEVGIIAIECAESGLYHVQSESLIVEVLRDDDQPCAPGEEGRVVVTDLHNFATPLIRYAIGDRAQVGPACSCGRELPTLTRILGRERHMVVLPSGERHWPLVGLHEYRRIAPILQYQVVQESTELVVLRLVTEAPLTTAQELELTAVLTRSLGHAFPVRFEYFEGELPRTAGGKREEFVSRVVSPQT